MTQKRQPAGAPASTGGQFTTEAKTEPDVALSEPVQEWSRSVDRPDADTYHWPRSTPRERALTAYDHDAATLRIGDDLNLKVYGVYGETSVQHWIGPNVSELSALRRAGVRGEAEVTVTYDDDHEWRLEFHTPSGIGLEVENRRCDASGFTQAVLRTYGYATQTSNAEDHGGAHVALNADMTAQAYRELAARGAKERVAELSNGGLCMISAAYSQPNDGSVALLVSPRGMSAPDYTVTVDPAGNAHIVQRQDQRDKKPVPTDQETLWLNLARHLSVKGGKRARAGEKLQAAFVEADRMASTHPDLDWLRGGLQS